MAGGRFGWSWKQSLLGSYIDISNNIQLYCLHTDMQTKIQAYARPRLLPQPPPASPTPDPPTPLGTVVLRGF